MQRPEALISPALRQQNKRGDTSHAMRDKRRERLLGDARVPPCGPAQQLLPANIAAVSHFVLNELTQSGTGRVKTAMRNGNGAHMRGHRSFESATEAPAHRRKLK